MIPKRTVALLAIACALATAPAPAMTTAGDSIVALVKAAPALTVDPKVPPIGGWSAKTHPYVRVGKNEQTPGGAIDPDFASIGRLADGTQVMAVPLFSGGSGGIFTQILFAQSDQSSKPFYLGAITSGGHLAVNVTYNGIVAISPIYGPNDPNCCPSKYERRTYAVAGRVLKLVARSESAKP